MSFIPCSNLFGKAAIVQDDPAVEINIDCVYRPFSSDVFFDQDRNWGIYNLDGRINSQAAYVRGENLSLVGQSSFLSNDVDGIDVIEDEHVYFGPLIPHYGHFLVTSLARAWYLSVLDRKHSKFLCHSDHPVDAHLRGSHYMAAFMTALGLEPGQLTRPERATRFRKLTIPGAAFLEQTCAHVVFATSMHQIGDALRPKAQGGEGRPVYLSKSRVGRHSVAHVTNEREIESLLHDRGIDIVYPEHLTITQQIGIFERTKIVLGFVGSALHTHVFVRQPPKIIGVALDSFVNSNLVILDRLNQADSNYYYPEGNIVPNDVEGFSVSRTIKDPQKFVDSLLEAAQLPSGRIYVHHTSANKEPGNSSMHDENCLEDHTGDDYKFLLARLHQELSPRAYLEIGTLTGGTLKLSSSPSIAIDPKFGITSDVIGAKERCLLYQVSSDDFFANFDPQQLLGGPLDFCFLDGMHHCEFLLRDFMNAERHSAPTGVIALHDCLPIEIPMTDRTQNGTPPVMPHRGGWWTGDVWRTVLALAKYRPDLRVLCLDAAPTGLVLVSNLDPASRTLASNYDHVVADMLAMELKDMTIAGFFRKVNVTQTQAFSAPWALARALGR